MRGVLFGLLYRLLCTGTRGQNRKLVQLLAVHPTRLSTAKIKDKKIDRTNK